MSDPVRFSRVWGMPSRHTFDCSPIGEFVQRYLSVSTVSVDPFCGNKTWATYSNDLNPLAPCVYHGDAEEFLRGLACDGVKADLVIFDPPYSPRQISECYKSVGREVGMEGTQNARLYKRVRDAVLMVCAEDATVLSFGWNSIGMGKSNGFVQVEIMLCCHGGAHNDTICLAERRLPKPPANAQLEWSEATNSQSTQSTKPQETP